MKEKEIIEAYDHIVSHNENYTMMIQEIVKWSYGMVLEPGAGTGLLTKELLLKTHNIIPVEISPVFLTKFRQRLPGQQIIKGDAVKYRCIKGVDCIAMSLVWHHIEDKRKIVFLKNMFRQLKKGGKIIIGDLFLPPYADERRRDECLRLFHADRIARTNDEFLKKVEEQALKEGLARDGEYKTSEEVLINCLEKTGFKNILTVTIGNQEKGGYRVIIAEK